jgi:hypothetical protein
MEKYIRDMRIEAAEVFQGINGIFDVHFLSG